MTNTGLIQYLVDVSAQLTKAANGMIRGEKKWAKELGVVERELAKRLQKASGSCDRWWPL